MTLNTFRLLGDLSHLVSILVLLFKIQKTKSASGISFKSQALYSLVFISRYLDLFLEFLSWYNTLMKVFYISSSLYIIYLMKFKYKDTWDPLVDSFRWEILITGSFALSLFINPKRSEPEFINVLWAFSIYLEAVSIIPQMFQFYITKEAENITVYYLFFLGSYRAWYIVNWIYRYHYENHLDWISILSGIVQTALYVCFLLLFRTPGRSLQIVGRQEFLEILLDYWNRMRSFFMGDRTWNHMSARVDEQCESIFVADDDAVPIENSAEHKSEEPVKDIKEDQQETIIEL